MDSIKQDTMSHWHEIFYPGSPESAGCLRERFYNVDETKISSQHIYLEAMPYFFVIKYYINTLYE